MNFQGAVVASAVVGNRNRGYVIDGLKLGGGGDGFSFVDVFLFGGDV
jgi:hypothetical protein